MDTDLVHEVSRDYANMADPMMLPRGSVDGSRNAKHFKNAKKHAFFIRHGQRMNGIYGKGMEGSHRVLLLSKFLGTTASMEGISAVLKYKPCMYLCVYVCMYVCIDV